MMYALMRYFKHKRPVVLKENLTFEQAQEHAEHYQTKKKRTGDFNSFVGFTAMQNL